MWQIIVAVLMGFLSGYIGVQLLTDPKMQARADVGTLTIFVWIMGYWAVAAALSAFLIWKRNRIGLVLGWTVIPGILRTAPGMLSKEMSDYLDGV